MPNIAADVRLRPIRFAFLVRPDDHRRAIEIFRVNTCLWGGKYNPVIPCFKKVPTWWDRHGHRFESALQIINGYLDFFEPDFLVEAESGLADGLGFSKERILQLSDVLVTENGKFREGNGLSVLDLYRHLYRKEFQFTRRHAHNIVDVIPENQSWRAFSACVFGSFPREPDRAYFSRAFDDAFAPTKVHLDSEALIKLFQSGFTSALLLGHSNIKIQYHDHGLDDPTLFVLDAREPRDLIDFWNLRAVRRDILPIPVQWVGELSVFCKELIVKSHRPLPDNPNGVMIRATVMFARSIPTTDIERLHADHFRVDVEGANVLQNWYPHFWRPSPAFVVREMRPTLSAAEKTFSLPVGPEEADVRFECLSPDFAEEYGSEYRWANVVVLEDWTFKNQVATVFLTNYKDPTYPKFGLGGEHLLPTTEGLVVFPRFRNTTTYWAIPDGTTAIAEWLKTHNINTAVSDAGRATHQIIQTLGGFWGVSSVAHPDIVKFLNEISRRPITRSAHHQEFRNRIKNATKGNVWLDHNFETLVERNAVELGLELRCVKCSSWSWYSLKQLDYTVTCGLCLKPFQFPVIEPSASNNSKWAYRLIGPFALPDYANGGYAAALSIRFFAEIIGRRHSSNVTWSAGRELELASNDRVESDFILWYQRKVHFGNDYQTDLVFGEAKSFKGANAREKRSLKDAFLVEDVERMRKLAIRFPGSILVFSTMKEAHELSKQEIGRLVKLAEWGREYIKERRQTRAPVIVLTGTELFTTYSLGQVWKAKGGLHAQFDAGWVHEDNLRVLADITQQLYLNMPSYGKWLDEKWKRRRERFKGSSQPPSVTPVSAT